MNTSLMLALATGSSVPRISVDGLFRPGPAELVAMAFSLGVAVWTYFQYRRPRRFIELPAAVIAPEFDGRGDEPGSGRAFRDAA